ncbi:uncharacterized protein FJT64_012379 [Amphibalanus amphitrite]|uniref:Mitochondrial transcription rescue factor 1 C-terminal domain-containing protein n=1 Tax=Amphibalanus amphitrite TaxID=1232801 RepID=A0A6A4VFR7_AMPAM|nr:uncharacterized protein FJT64_012379 [Amphibalanus amphitrite]
MKLGVWHTVDTYKVSASPIRTSRKPAVPYEHAQLSKIQIISIRHKKKKASSSPVEDGDDSDGSEDDDEQGNDFKVLKGSVNSTRIDSVLKFALGMSRNKVENAFYSNSIYLNGERLDKKKHSVTIEDEVDVVRGLNTLNPSFIDVHRVEVLDIQRSRTDPDKLVIKVKRFKRLTIDNYARPWKPPVSE